MIKYMLLTQDIEDDSTFSAPQGAFPLAIVGTPTGGQVMFAITMDEYRKQLAADPEFAASFKPKDEKS